MTGHPKNSEGFMLSAISYSSPVYPSTRPTTCMAIAMQIGCDAINITAIAHLLGDGVPWQRNGILYRQTIQSEVNWSSMKFNLKQLTIAEG